MTTEPSPLRDNGPYQDVGQVMAQFSAVMFGIPEDARLSNVAVILEAALMTCGMSEFERKYLESGDERFTPAQAQIIAGLIYRAWMAGKESA